MRGKAALVVGLATGYVLGTRDGRARYQQIKTQFDRIVSDPRVQEKSAQAADLAKAKAPVVKDKLAGVTDKATSTVGSKSESTSGSARSSRGSSLGADSDLPPQTTVTAPDLTQDADDASSGTSKSFSSDSSTDTGTPSAGTTAGDAGDEDAIVLTPPSPSPLAPGPTNTDSSGPATGGQHG